MKGGFLRSTSIVGAMTLVSRITGVVRETVYAAMLGASPAMDAFLVAFKIPNFLRRITAEGAFSQAFVPVVSEYRLKREQAEVEALVAGVTGTLGLLLLAVTLVGVVAAPNADIGPSKVALGAPIFQPARSLAPPGAAAAPGAPGAAGWVP